VPVILLIRADIGNEETTGTLFIELDAHPVPTDTSIVVRLPFWAPGAQADTVFVDHRPDQDGADLAFRAPPGANSSLSIELGKVVVPPPQGNIKPLYYLSRSKPDSSGVIRPTIVLRSKEFYGRRYNALLPDRVEFVFERAVLRSHNGNKPDTKRKGFRLWRGELQREDHEFELEYAGQPAPVTPSDLDLRFIQVLVMGMVVLVTGGPSVILAATPELIRPQRRRVRIEAATLLFGGLLIVVPGLCFQRPGSWAGWYLPLAIYLVFVGMTAVLEWFDGPESTTRRVTVLIVATQPPHNPLLDLDREFREINEKITKSTNGGCFDVIPSLAARWRDSMRDVRTQQPCIVHFCGHADESGRIVLRNNDESEKPIEHENLVDFVASLDGYIKLIILNGCSTEGQARALAEVIKCAIGVENKIPDATAIKFATDFYAGVVSGDPLNEAFTKASACETDAGHPRDVVPPDQSTSRAGIVTPATHIINWNKGITAEERLRFRLFDPTKPD
jgi:hypothetical protein